MSDNQNLSVAIEPLEAEDGYSDSGFGSDISDTTSISSSIYAGHVENGRRYQTLREGEYWGPSDEKQFESMEAVHIMHLILDSKAKNPLFYAPVSENVQNILDIGTGSGIWAKEVADKYSSAVVTGVDLFPPPNTWVPPNCRLEVDDVLKEWTFIQRWDLIHLRWLSGAFTDEQWRLLYKQAYKNLLPGGYIEQVEPSVNWYCDDGTLPAESLLAQWGPIFIRAAAKTGKNIDTIDTFRARIEAAGFKDVKEKIYKCPIGGWTKNPILKEAGIFNEAHVKAGMEGYAMYLLTKYGDPQPWSAEDVQVFLARVRKEMEKGYHCYLTFKRVYARKPLEG